jgi:small subunit ribosomal protein S1
VGRHLPPLPAGTRLFGKVTNLTDYGAFVEIEQGIEGLVHVSEMDWTNKNVHPSKVVQLGDEVEVMILEIDEDRRRISLGMKQCAANPWDEFSMNHKKGDKVRGADQVDHRLRRVHRPARRHRRPGSPVRPVVVADRRRSHPQLQEGRRSRSRGAGHRRTEKERISLGIKQLDGDPYTSFIATHEKNSHRARHGQVG